MHEKQRACIMLIEKLSLSYARNFFYSEKKKNKHSKLFAIKHFFWGGGDIFFLFYTWKTIMHIYYIEWEEMQYEYFIIAICDMCEGEMNYFRDMASEIYHIFS